MSGLPSDCASSGPRATSALDAVRAATQRLGYSLPTLVAETALWVHPDEHTRRITEDNPTGAVFPHVRRARLGSGEEAGGVVDGVKLDRNNYAGTAIRQVIGVPRETLEGYEACHIWPATCYDARYHTVLANLVLVPGPLAALTDHDPDVIAAIQYRSWELYGWHPFEVQPPNKPLDYPTNWKTPVARSRTGRQGGARPPGQPSHRDVMRRLFAEHGGDREAVVRAYAEAERRGEVQRTSNLRGMSAVDYARRLWADGTKKGWLACSNDGRDEDG